MFEHISFDDGRGRYPSRIAAQVPRELRREAEAVAERQGISLGEFARRALINALHRNGNGALPASGQAPEALGGED